MIKADLFASLSVGTAQYRCRPLWEMPTKVREFVAIPNTTLNVAFELNGEESKLKMKEYVRKRKHVMNIQYII